jgi:hypothetical protein
MAVLIPMRRGRGASGGEYLERHECDLTVLGSGVTAASRMEAVLVRADCAGPISSASAGGSRAGVCRVYPHGQTNARGVINFAGGWSIERDNWKHFNRDTPPRPGRSRTP